MAAELTHLRGQLASDSLLQPSVIEKGNVLRPRKADHHPQPVRRRFVEQLARGRRVRADRIDPHAGHQPEVFGDLFGGRKLMTVGVGREGPVGDALDEESLVADA